MIARRLLSTAILVLAPVLVAAAALALGDTVPDPLPTHWNTRGEVDDTSAFGTFTAIILVITSLLAVVGIVVTWRARTRTTSAVVAMPGWLAWLFALLYGATLVVSDGAARAESVDLPWWVVLAVLVGSGLAWLALHRLLPPHEQSAVRPGFTTMSLADDERAVWVGSARSAAMGWLGAGLAVTGAVLLFLEPVLGAGTLFVGVLVWWLHQLTVRVDDEGVRAGWGPLRWPGRSIALADIASAEAEEVEPMKWGGWGYRVSGRGTGLVVRRGPGIVLHRVSGGDVAITVDGADEAVSLVNALVRRAGVAR